MSEVTISNDLSKILAPRNERCTVVFRNKLPADWEIRIIQIGVKFIYKKSSVNENIIRNTNILGPSGADSIQSTRPDECVEALWLSMKDIDSDGVSQDYLKMVTAPEGKCYLTYGIGLVPTQFFQPGSPRSALIEVELG